MSKDTQLANAVASAQADALARLLDNGYLRIYSGSKPATADTAITSQTLLCELRFPATSAPGASNGVLTFNAITAVAVATSGTAAWFRALKSDGTSVVFDGTVDVSANTPNLTVATTTLTAGVSFVVDSFTHTVAKATTGY